MEPLRVPLAVKILLAVGLLFAINELAPGVAPTVLVLVALYLILSRSNTIANLVASTSRSFNSALQPPATGAR